LKQIINDLIAQALLELEQASQIPSGLGYNIQVTPSKDPAQGDYASNIALMLAKPSGMPPRDLAQLIVDRIAVAGGIDRIEIAGFHQFFRRQRHQPVDRQPDSGAGR
jgi:arginyl-tRNA synthetase